MSGMFSLAFVINMYSLPSFQYLLWTWSNTLKNTWLNNSFSWHLCTVGVHLLTMCLSAPFNFSSAFFSYSVSTLNLLRHNCGPSVHCSVRVLVLTHRLILPQRWIHRVCAHPVNMPPMKCHSWALFFLYWTIASESFLSHSTYLCFLFWFRGWFTETKVQKDNGMQLFFSSVSFPVYVWPNE